MAVGTVSVIILETTDFVWDIKVINIWQDIYWQEIYHSLNIFFLLEIPLSWKWYAWNLISVPNAYYLVY